jgi:hypothetical protein
VALVRTRGLEEHITSIIREERMSDLGMLAVTSYIPQKHQFLQELPLFLADTLHPDRGDVPLKCRFSQEPHIITSQKTTFFNMLVVMKKKRCYLNKLKRNDGNVWLHHCLIN